MAKATLAVSRGKGVSQRGQRDTDPVERSDRGALVNACVEAAAGCDAREGAPGRCRGSAGVEGRSRWVEKDCRPRLPHTPAQIDIFAVQKEALVEPTELFEDASPDEQTRARNPIGRPYVLVGGWIAHDLVGPGSVRRESMKEQRLTERS